MIKVLLTGASGFIGRHCISHLLDKDYEVHCVYNNSKPVSKTGIVWHKADLFEYSDIEKLVSSVKPSHILHLAWYSEHEKFWTSTFNNEWVKASLGLLNIANKYGVKRIVGAGSCAEYEWNKEIYQEYSTSVKPSTLYGQSKAATASMFEGYGRNKLSTAWGRIFFLYGLYEDDSKLVSSVIKSIFNNEIAVCKYSQLRRDYLNVDDVASALVTLLISNVRGAVNIASGDAIKLGDLVTLISRITGKENLIKLEENICQDNIPLTIQANVKRLSEEVAWAPVYNLEQGIKTTVEWWESNVIQ